MLKLIAQESYRALNMTKKINPEGLENGAIDVKKINEKSTVFDGPLLLVSLYWHYKLVLPKFNICIGSKQLFRCSSWSVISF